MVLYGYDSGRLSQHDRLSKCQKLLESTRGNKLNCSRLPLAKESKCTLGWLSFAVSVKICDPGGLKYFRPFLITMGEGLGVLLEPAAELDWTCWPSSAPNPNVRNMLQQIPTCRTTLLKPCAPWLSSWKVDHVVPTEHRTHFIYASLMHYRFNYRSALNISNSVSTHCMFQLKN